MVLDIFRHCPILSHSSKRVKAQRDAVETKLGGMKIKQTLEVGSPIIIIEAPPMLKPAEPMPIMQPNTGRLKPNISNNLFIGKKILEKTPNIYECGFCFLAERKILLNFCSANLFAKAQCVLLHKQNP
jgi:hypothetical protein